ncbi:hypothetical protein diail_8120 [Diaporthe ilicicola]|nr:hypothetical protein diail_8120 [Diaporthe ilicicola]
MRSAVITSWGSPPEYIRVPDLPPPSPTQLQLRVVAVGVPMVVRARALRKHVSTFNAALPFDPSLDGVGKDEDTGDLYYIAVRPSSRGGASGVLFAERANVDRSQLVRLEAGADPVAVAALVNPVASSWLALRCRAAGGCEGRTVLIIGATSASGRAAVAVARELGAARVVGMSRSQDTLDQVAGLDDRVLLRDPVSLPARIGPVHIVLDYVGGSISAGAMQAVEVPPSEDVQYILVGGLSGETDVAVPGLVNRKPIRIMGSGMGAWSMQDLERETPGLVNATAKMKRPDNVIIKPLAEVQSVWETPPQEYPYTNVVAALRYAAAHTTEGIIAYEPNKSDDPTSAQQLSYKELLSLAEANAGLPHHHVPDRIRPGPHGAQHVQQFKQNVEDQKLHLEHLCTTLDDITKAVPVTTDSKNPAFQPLASDLAALMLTSGSSGAAKVVPLTHGQLLAAFNGKIRIANLQYRGRPFLSWIGMDHVANLVQCHLYAIMSCLSQIQVPAVHIVADPLKLLNLVSRHGVSRTFAPNFLLVKLLRQLDSGKLAILDEDLDLSGLVLVDSGGESNVTNVCVRLQSWLSKYGAPDHVMKPGFGMTETCAGFTNNLECPEYDQEQGLDFVSLGRCMPGARMRVSRLNKSDSGSERGKLCEPGERGSLEISGPVVFKGYYNNDAATSEAFTEDSWFRTGDLAWLDQRGCLHLDGRTKEVMNINAVKYLPNELESLLERAKIAGATPTYFCCFSTRDASMDTEVVTVLFVPSYDQDNDEARFNTQSSIFRVTGMHTGSRPRVLPLSIQDMPKSTLGKLPRGKLQAALEAGVFAAQSQANDTAIKRYREKTRRQPETSEEAAMLDIIREQLELFGKKTTSQ